MKSAQLRSIEAILCIQLHNAERQFSFRFVALFFQKLYKFWNFLGKIGIFRGKILEFWVYSCCPNNLCSFWLQKGDSCLHRASSRCHAVCLTSGDFSIDFHRAKRKKRSFYKIWIKDDLFIKNTKKCYTYWWIGTRASVRK